MKGARLGLGDPILCLLMMQLHGMQVRLLASWASEQAGNASVVYECGNVTRIEPVGMGDR